jgi:hypothetical protein
MEKIIYFNQDKWNKMNYSLCSLFNVEYQETEIPNFDFDTKMPPPWNKGKSLGEEWSTSRKGYKRTPEQEQRNIEHLNELRKTMYTKERAEKISNSLKGYKMSEERKRNISEAKKGKKYTEEQKRKRSEDMRNWHLSRKGHTHKDPSI